MLYLLGKRAQHSLVLLFLASVLCFSLVVSAPGNVAILIAELRGMITTPGYVEQIAEEIGLHKPLLVRYADWIAGVLQGDFGISYRTGVAVSETLAQRLSVTATLIAGGAIMALVISFVLGFVGALWAYRVPDRLARVVALLGASTPTFFLGALLIYLFSVSLRLLPSFGYAGPETWIMPWLAISALPAAGLSRVIRVGLEEAMSRPYVLTAMSKGLSRPAILFRDALPNVMPGYINALGTQVGLMTASAIIVEPLFAWQGLGEYFISGVRFRDFMVVQACLMMFLTFFIIVNLIVDLAVLAVDPRIRKQGV